MKLVQGVNVILALTLALSASLFGSPARAAAPDSLWMRTYGGDLTDECRGITQTSDGGYVLTGGMVRHGDPGSADHQDVYVARLAANGDTLWTRHFGGIADNCGYAVRETPDGGFAVAGFRTNTMVRTDRDIYLLKLDAAGTLQWEKVYGHAGDDEAYDLQVLSSGSMVVVGYTRTTGTYSDVWLLRAASNGDTLRTRQFDFTNWDRGQSVCLTTDGYVVCGYATRDSHYDVLLMKADASLNLAWSKMYGGAYSDVGLSVKPAPLLGFIVAGWQQSGESGPAHGWALSMNSRGDTLWTAAMSDSISNQFHSVDVISGGGYVLAGLRGASLAGRDFYVVKLGSEGAREWETTYGTTTEDDGLSVECTDDGQFVIGGRTGLSGTGTSDVLVVKTGVRSGVAEGAGTGDGGTGVGPFSLRASPNPGPGGTVLRFDLAVAGEVELAVFDVEGRLRANLVKGRLPSGPHRVAWNGTGPAACAAPPGVYYARLTNLASGMETTRKFVLAR